MSTAIAAIEQCNPVPGTPTDKDILVNEIESLVSSLHVRELLTMYNTSIQALGSAKDAKYFLLQLDVDKKRVIYWRYKALDSEEANRKYTEMESSISDDSDMQVVLVSVENITALQRAYPNYFLDTNAFSQLVARVRKRDFPDPLPHPSNNVAL